MRDRRRPTKPGREAAEEIGARALLYLADDSGRLGQFLAETGLDPSTLRENIHAPETIAAALGHLMSDESALLAFAANAGLEPEVVAYAATLLSGHSEWDGT